MLVVTGTYFNLHKTTRSVDEGKDTVTYNIIDISLWIALYTNGEVPYMVHRTFAVRCLPPAVGEEGCSKQTFHMENNARLMSYMEGVRILPPMQGLQQRLNVNKRWSKTLEAILWKWYQTYASLTLT
jgi:hypothetical protein